MFQTTHELFGYIFQNYILNVIKKNPKMKEYSNS